MLVQAARVWGNVIEWYSTCRHTRLSIQEPLHMTEDNFTLTTFYAQWKAYQEQIKESIAPLAAEQLALRAGSGLRSIGENATHIASVRAGWFTYTLGEDGGADV